MKQISFILGMALLFMLSSCSKETITGRGETGTRTFQLPDFSAVEAHYDIDAVISSGANREVVLSGYENLLAVLDVKVENGVLKLKYNTNYNYIRKSNVKATIKIPALAKAAIYGSGDVDVNGFNGARGIILGIYGSGNIRVNNSAYDTAVLDIYGSGDIKAQGLRVKEATANVFGSGHTAISVSEKLLARIFGSGDVHYWGSATVQTTQNGSGRVIKQ